MTNKEYKSNVVGFLESLKVNEHDTFDSTNKVIGVDLFKLSDTLSDKTIELLEVFENDDMPLNMHLIVILSSQYLRDRYINFVQDSIILANSVLKATIDQDKQLVQQLMEEQSAHQLAWTETDEYIRNFNLQDNFEDVMNSGFPSIERMGIEKVRRICLEELRKVNIFPKDPDEESPKMPSP